MMKQRVLLQGTDAVDLINRISTIQIPGPSETPSNDISGAISGLILNPQGKIVACFQLTRLNETDLQVDFETEFLTALEQYTFAEKYKIIPLDPPQKESFQGAEQDSIHHRIETLTPQIGYEFLEDGTTNPLEVNLRSWIHDHQGCYPGQEVIEKIISLGSPPRKLCQIKTASSFVAPVLPASLTDESGVIVGTLTSIFENSGLAILKRTHCKVGAHVQHEGTSFTVEKVQP